MSTLTPIRCQLAGNAKYGSHSELGFFIGHHWAAFIYSPQGDSKQPAQQRRAIQNLRKHNATTRDPNIRDPERKHLDWKRIPPIRAVSDFIGRHRALLSLFPGNRYTAHFYTLNRETGDASLRRQDRNSSITARSYVLPAAEQ